MHMRHISYRICQHLINKNTELQGNANTSNERKTTVILLTWPRDFIMYKMVD